MIRKARSLFISGALPQAIWGNQCAGMNATQLKKLRVLAASASGIGNTSRRCLTSCLAFCYGRRKDPWHILIKELFVLWVQICPVHGTKYPNDLRQAWGNARDEICCTNEEGVPFTKWGKVTGVISNVIATLSAHLQCVD